MRGLPDVRDGLNREERAVLRKLAELQSEFGDKSVPTLMLYGRVLEDCDMSATRFQSILERLGARREQRSSYPPPPLDED